MTTPPEPPPGTSPEPSPDPLPQLGFDVGVFYADLLASACAEQRMWGIERWREYLGDTAHLLPLLDDDAPVVRTHGDAPVLVEVRAAALVALQDRHRGVTHGWPYGPVTVRRAMRVSEALAQAERLLTDLEPARLEAINHQVDLAITRVQPPTDDQAACRAYLVLKALDAVPYLRQEVDPDRLLTPLQVEIHASQLRSPRPLPHLRVDGPEGPAGYLYRGTSWVVEADESPLGQKIARLIDQVRHLDRAGLPRVLLGRDGMPRTGLDGRFRLDGVVPDDDEDGYLRSVAAFVARQHPCTLVTGPSTIPERWDLRALAGRRPSLSAAAAEAAIEAALVEDSSTLDLSGAGLVTLPSSIGRLSELQTLYLQGNALVELPEQIGELTSLFWLDLHDNLLTTLPDAIGRLGELVSLDLGGNRLTALPDTIADLADLERLDLGGNHLDELPDAIGHLGCLIELNLNDNRLPELPATIGQLHSLQSLSVYGNRLTALPPELGALDRLASLQLGGNRLTELPAELAGLTSLVTLIGLTDEPLIAPAYLKDNWGAWDTEAQQALATYYAVRRIKRPNQGP